MRCVSAQLHRTQTLHARASRLSRLDRRSSGVDLPATAIFDYPSIELLAGMLAPQLQLAPPSMPAPDAEPNSDTCSGSSDSSSVSEAESDSEAAATAATPAKQAPPHGSVASALALVPPTDDSATLFSPLLLAEPNSNAPTLTRPGYFTVRCMA